MSTLKSVSVPTLHASFLSVLTALDWRNVEDEILQRQGCLSTRGLGIWGHLLLRICSWQERSLATGRVGVKCGQQSHDPSRQPSRVWSCDT